MDYKDIRKRFVEMSGRYDLIKSTDEDDGADFFLNAGQKYLDRLLDSGKMKARYPVALTAGTIVAKSVGIRAIKEVWVADADGKAQLMPSDLHMLRKEYSEESASISRGLPKYYAPACFRPFPDELASTTGLHDVEDLLITGTHYTYNGVIVMPPPDKTYTLTIWGLFYSPTLLATLADAVWTQTKSYWTEVMPEVLLEAAQQRLASFYRDTRGMEDYKKALMDDVQGIDFDAVEEDLVGNMQMGG